jgi:hypothetical protein
MHRRRARRLQRHACRTSSRDEASAAGELARWLPTLALPRRWSMLVPETACKSAWWPMGDARRLERWRDRAGCWPPRSGRRAVPGQRGYAGDTGTTGGAVPSADVAFQLAASSGAAVRRFTQSGWCARSIEWLGASTWGSRGEGDGPAMGIERRGPKPRSRSTCGQGASDSRGSDAGMRTRCASENAMTTWSRALSTGSRATRTSAGLG